MILFTDAAKLSIETVEIALSFTTISELCPETPFALSSKNEICNNNTRKYPISRLLPVDLKHDTQAASAGSLRELSPRQ